MDERRAEMSAMREERPEKLECEIQMEEPSTSMGERVKSLDPKIWMRSITNFGSV